MKKLEVKVTKEEREVSLPGPTVVGEIHGWLISTFSESDLKARLAHKIKYLREKENITEDEKETLRICLSIDKEAKGI